MGTEIERKFLVRGEGWRTGAVGRVLRQGFQTEHGNFVAGVSTVVGLASDGSLIVRPTIVADATGHLSFNLTLTGEVRLKLYEWLSIDTNGLCCAVVYSVVDLTNASIIVYR